MDNTKEIRGLLEKAKSEVFKRIPSELWGLIIQPIEEVLSLLPPVCKICKGSGRKPILKDSENAWVICPCQAPQCKVCKQIYYTCNPLNAEGVCHNCRQRRRPKCQAPATGEVEEFVKKARKYCNSVIEYAHFVKDNATEEKKEEITKRLYDLLFEGFEIITALSKQIEGFEAGAFGANEEAQIRDDRIKQLEKALKKLLSTFPETIPEGQEKLAFDIPGYIVEEARKILRGE